MNANGGVILVYDYQILIKILEYSEGQRFFGTDLSSTLPDELLGLLGEIVSYDGILWYTNASNYSMNFNCQGPDGPINGVLRPGQQIPLDGPANVSLNDRYILSLQKDYPEISLPQSQDASPGIKEAQEILAQELAAQAFTEGRKQLDKALRDLSVNMEETVNAFRVMEARLWSKPFTELTERLREIDSFIEYLGYNNANPQVFLKNVQFMRKKLAKTLSRLGIVEYFPSRGDIFDPMLHEDIDPTSQGVDLTIDEIREPGYRTDMGVLLKATVVTVMHSG
ncbi:MAG: nucleotide exchange factor GrpE [Clostridiales bacterium]|jgi:molecular chaperone GrpE (heat shock protein)|nr:nucleotide exchange factor GrpE [Clostridiales bacterium]